MPIQKKKISAIEHPKELSEGSALIKLVDKISNITDITNTPPTDRNSSRRLEYFDWADQVINNCPKVNTSLEKHFKYSNKKGREKLQ